MRSATSCRVVTRKRISPSFRANEPLRSLYLLRFCAAAASTCVEAARGTKVKGFLKHADSYRREKRSTHVLFDRHSPVPHCYRTLGTVRVLEYLPSTPYSRLTRRNMSDFPSVVVVYLEIHAHLLIRMRDDLLAYCLSADLGLNAATCAKRQDDGGLVSKCVY